MAEKQALHSQPDAAPSRSPLITGDSEMARLIRGHNWAATPIGPIDGWSQTLVATVNLMLHSPFPTILSWGPEFVFLYNDAAIPTLMGKHPTALGGLYHEVFHEAWDLVSDLVQDDGDAAVGAGHRQQRDSAPGDLGPVRGGRGDAVGEFGEGGFEF